MGQGQGGSCRDLEGWAGEPSCASEKHTASETFEGTTLM